MDDEAMKMVRKSCIGSPARDPFSQQYEKCNVTMKEEESVNGKIID
ncbi:MAG: hypothetical protein ABOK23_00585 [Candidatus Methanoperedens sp.]|nr:hypothetical protein [Candidatus Methanoperedens sp.]MCZ7395851.1 hypothetical protein [Candidatus Methanoperedens sp.]